MERILAESPGHSQSLAACAPDATPRVALDAVFRGGRTSRLTVTEAGRPPTSPVEEHRRAASALLEAGEPLSACDRLAESLSQFPGDVRLRQLLALGLARSGASRSANALLQRLVAEGHADEETLGMLARTHKDLWATARDPADRAAHLRQAVQSYARAYRETGGYWTGINAATMALVAGERSQAEALAREVRARCLEAASRAEGDARYWVVATLAEAALLVGDRDEADERYAEAAALAGRRFGLIASTRRNARLILHHVGGSGARIEAALRVPRVAVFAGHLVDAPGRTPARFPPELAPSVGAAIAERLASLDVGFGFASAASGADLLFHEALLARGAEAHVVLPYDRATFVADSVDVPPGAGWTERFDRVLARAVDVVVASPERLGSGALSFEYGLRIMDGLAGLRADELGAELVAIAVWDGRPGDGPGGTASAVDLWRQAGRSLEIVDLEALRGPGPDPPAPSRGRAPSTLAHASDDCDGFDARIVGVLFADARGFSGLSEGQVRPFVRHFLGEVAAELARSECPPAIRNTWGDGLYFVFERVADAGRFALGLLDALARCDWAAHHLPSTLELRIGLHAGPAYLCVDPVTGRPNYFGTHVSRAARIEPVTPPGLAYASQAFAALARSERAVRFRCEYVGRTPLAKGYGTFPMYVVHPADTPTLAG
jgi:hypothetical protein